MQHHSHKLFVLVDRTLTRSQQAVQACHAVAEFALRYGDVWSHQSLVLLGVDCEQDMKEWMRKLTCNKVGFFESYWDNRLTAIAAHGCDEAVSKLPLL